jgi:hypothetical protein
LGIDEFMQLKDQMVQDHCWLIVRQETRNSSEIVLVIVVVLVIDLVIFAVALNFDNEDEDDLRIVGLPPA